MSWLTRKPRCNLIMATFRPPRRNLKVTLRSSRTENILSRHCTTKVKFTWIRKILQRQWKDTKRSLTVCPISLVRNRCYRRRGLTSSILRNMRMPRNSLPGLKILHPTRNPGWKRWGACCAVSSSYRNGVRPSLTQKISWPKKQQEPTTGFLQIWPSRNRRS